MITNFRGKSRSKPELGGMVALVSNFSHFGIAQAIGALERSQFLESLWLLANVNSVSSLFPISKPSL